MRPPRPSAAAAAVVAALALAAPGARASGPTPGGAAPTAPGWDVASLRQVDQQRIRGELRRVLASDELRAGAGRRDATTAAAALWLRLQAFIGRQPAGVTRAVVVVCVLVLLAVVAHLVFSVRSVLRGERRRARAAPATERRRAPAAARNEAVGLAARGEHAEALRLLHLAALWALDEWGLCAVGDATVDRIVVDRCRGLADVAGPLGELVEAFQRSRFGGRPCGPDEFARCLGHLDAILAAGAARAAAAGRSGPAEAAA